MRHIPYRMQKGRQGFGLFDVLLTSIISLVIATQVIDQIQDSETTIQASNVSLEMGVLQKAVANYLKSNERVLMSNLGDNQIAMLPLTGTAGPVAGTSSLLDSGVIQPSTSFLMPKGQHPVIFIRKVPLTTTLPNQISSSKLEALTTTYGGNPYNDRLLGQVLQKLGSQSGAIMNTRFKGQKTGSIRGAYGTWSYDPKSWANNAHPFKCDDNNIGNASPEAITCGRPVVMSNSGNGVISEYLDRYDIGFPEANTMHTDIDFTGNSLRNVRALDGVSGQNLNISSKDSMNTVVTQNNLHICSNPANTTDCGVVLGNQDSTLTNTDDGWTTLRQNIKGFHIAGGNAPNLKLQGALMIDGTGGSNGSSTGSTHPTGLMFSTNLNNWSSGDTFGAHIYQDNPQFLTITGGNGFNTLYIAGDPSSAQAARVQMLSTQIYGDGNGLLSLRVADGGGAVKIEHPDGTQADLTLDAINLGTSQGVSENGKTYGAVYKGPCQPNGRMAMLQDTDGEMAICRYGRWGAVSDNNPNGGTRFNTRISVTDGSASYTNTTGASLLMIAQNSSYDYDNVFTARLSDGTVPCIFQQSGRHTTSSGQTCSFMLPAGMSLLSGGFPSGTKLSAYQ